MRLLAAAVKMRDVGANDFFDERHASSPRGDGHPIAASPQLGLDEPLFLAQFSSGRACFAKIERAMHVHLRREKATNAVDQKC